MSFHRKYLVNRSGNRQRLRDALNRKFTGEVPFLECYVAEDIVDKVMGRPMGTHMLKLAADEYVEFIKRTGMDAAYLYEGWFLGRKNKTDNKGRIHYIDGMIKSRDNFDQIIIPSLDPVKRRIEGFLEAARGTNLGVVYALDTSVTLMITAIGPTDSLVFLYDAPDFINEFLNRVEEYTIPLVECILQYPIDAIWVSGLQCGKMGPIISPAMQEEFIFPRIKKVMDIIRPAGIPVVLHTDGDNSIFMDWIIETGFAGIHPVEAGIPGFNIYNLKETYGGKICLCGNIDVGLLARGTPDKVIADTLKHIHRLAPGGGYVCGSSHDISDNIPFENFCALAQTICLTFISPEGFLKDISLNRTRSYPAVTKSQRC